MNDRVALVTGASSGIGEATAGRLASAGYTVYGSSRRGAAAGKRPFEMLALDVTSNESVEAVVHEVLRRSGRIDLLVNNAGFGVGLAGDEESSVEQAQAIFDTNFFGTVRMTRAVVPHMRRQAAGRILNIGSGLGFVPMPYMAVYSASKHALEGYSESLDHELRTRGIRVIVIEPGVTKTPFDANVLVWRGRQIWFYSRSSFRPCSRGAEAERIGNTRTGAPERGRRPARTGAKRASDKTRDDGLATLEPDSKLDDYREIRAALNQRYSEVVAAGDAPEAVAEVVLKAATAARPKVRYPVGRVATFQLLRRFAPGLMDAGIRRDLRLDAPTATSGGAKP